jgi:hypothetical protein
MQPYFYSDKLDLLKWGAVISIAKAEKISYILQVPFPPVSSLRPTLYSGEEPIQLSDEVWRHFRNPGEIERLGHSTGLEIEYWQQEVRRGAGKRAEYQDRLTEKVRSRSRTRKIVLLDPDTGIKAEPISLAHISRRDIEAVWHELAERDWLAVYQHKPLAGTTDWLMPRASEFEIACGQAAVRKYTATLSKRKKETLFPAVLLAARK